jgi:hypothetical protein
MQALYAYTARDARELSFSTGDVIEVLKREGEWWQGIVNGITGYFPQSYVGDISEVRRRFYYSEISRKFPRKLKYCMIMSLEVRVNWG